MLPEQVMTVEYMDQDKQILESLAHARRLLTTVENHDELAGELAAFGYTAEAVTTCWGLIDTAQAAVDARQDAMGEQDAAYEDLRIADETARRTYADYRAVTRALYKNKDDRHKLGLNGIVPKDREKFLTLARTSYTAARNAPYTEILAAYGFDTAALDAAEAELDALNNAHSHRQHADGAARDATVARDQAVEELEAWISRFRRIARVALRDRPGLLIELSL